MKKNKLLLPCITILMCIILAITVHLVLKDAIVINLGIRAYTQIRIVIAVILSLIVVGVVIYLICVLRSDISNPKQSTENQPPEIESKYTESHKQTLREVLQSTVYKWPSFGTQINTMVQNLDTMGTYMKSLHDILKRNDVMELDDTLEILSKIEDCMYRNVDMILNYMEVVDANDTQLLAGRMDKFITRNAEMFKTAKELRLSIVDYIGNNSGGEESEKLLHTINSYKSLLLETVEMEDL